MKVNYAQFLTKQLPLTNDFGMKLGLAWFGKEAIEALPKYVRGKNKGKPKGWVVWDKVIKGGWVQTEHGEGYVETRVESTINHTLCSHVSNQYGISPGPILVKGKLTNRLDYLIAYTKQHIKDMESTIENNTDYENIERYETRLMELELELLAHKKFSSEIFENKETDS